MAPNNLPQETIDHIISYLHDDKHSLSSTSLVRRSWAPQSRHYLFSSVSVKAYVASFDSFLQFVKHNADESKFSLPICTMVHTLHLSGPIVAGKLHEGLPIITVAFVAELCSVLKKLKNLKFTTVQFGDADIAEENRPENLQGLLDIRKTLTLDTFEAEVFWTRKPSLTNLPHVLSLFESVAELRILGPYWPADRPLFDEVVVDPIVPAVSAPAISRVRLCLATYPPLILALIRRRSPVSALRSIDVSCFSSKDIRALGLILRTIGPHVQQLVLDLTSILTQYRDDPLDHVQEFDPSPCRNLETLGFRMSVASDGTRCSDPGLKFLDVTSFLDKASHSLRKVVLILRIGREDLESGSLQAIFQLALEAEFQWLRVGLARRPEVKELEIRWVDEYHSAGVHGEPGFGPELQEALESLSDVVRVKLAGITPRVTIDGQLYFMELEQCINGHRLGR
ncbi:hypothetical protein EIP86_000248 [Pleurotus ostreatoroseus]|nr:hypothetical protein EIP86_000248 [Pleurotus ostreatoroseus]